MNEAQLKPMKAPSESATREAIEAGGWPRQVSVKLDGLRALGVGKVLVSKTITPFRNEHLNEVMRSPLLHGLDGELVVGDPRGDDVIRRTSSGITSRDGQPDFRLFVFDDFTEPSLPFELRHKKLPARVAKLPAAIRRRVEVVEHPHVYSFEELVAQEEAALEQRYEGLMIRLPTGQYKFGRCTTRQGLLLKFKRFVDGEARVVALLEGTHNLNETTLRGDGTKKRSTHKAGKVASGLLGTIVGADIATGATVNISPGRMSHAEREKYMLEPHLLLGKIVTYRHFPTGTVNTTRFNTFQCIREVSDL